MKFSNLEDDFGSLFYYIDIYSMSVAQVGLNYEKKTDGRKSRWRVPLECQSASDAVVQEYHPRTCDGSYCKLSQCPACCLQKYHRRTCDVFLDVTLPPMLSSQNITPRTSDVSLDVKLPRMLSSKKITPRTHDGS